MKRKKLIPLLLLLLLLLIILCVWQHSEEIVKNRAMSATSANTTLATTPVTKKDIDFKFVKEGDNLELTGNFSTDKSVQTLHTAIGETNFSDHSNINSELSPKEGVIELTRQLLLPFTQKYKNGSITYADETITIEGVVESQEDKNAIDTLLANTTIASQDNTRVVQSEPTAQELQAQQEAQEAKVKAAQEAKQAQEEKAAQEAKAMAEQEAKQAEEAKAMVAQTPATKEDIDFKFVKEGDNLELTGNFATKGNVETLQATMVGINFNNQSNINSERSPKEGVIDLTQQLLLPFTQKYKNGSITYADETITIEGVVESQEDKDEIAAILANATIASQDNTRVVQPEPTVEELALIQAQQEAQEAKAEQEAKQAQEVRSVQEVRTIQETKALQEERRNAFVQELRDLIAIEPINFEFNKARLTPKSLKTIKRVVELLNKYPEINIEIAGHTDSYGNDEQNLILSQRRVDAVKNKLIELNIDSNRLRAVGYGESQPLVSNDTKENRLINRRVEFRIIGE
jgi:outer membrane protein OmpA-like peptidoglycan-associated protein